MKNKLSGIAALLMAVIILLIPVSGCMSPLASAMEQERKAREIHPLVLDEVFSEDMGFHFPGLSWDMDVVEVRNKTYAPITTVIGYSENGEVAYNANGMRMSYLDQVNDQTAVTVTKEGKVYIISLIYYQDESNAGRTMGLSELYGKLMEDLTEKFGEPEILTDEHEVNGTKTYTESGDWTYTLKDNRKTHMQFAKTTVGAAKDPGYISLGFTIDMDTVEE